jgi:hypothetical protein
MIDAIKDITPEHMILALTMHETVDQLSTISPNEPVNQYCVVPGYLCNGPTHVGKKITTQHLMDYVSANMQIRPPNSWPHGFKKYINITNHFCLVRSIQEYANSSEERRKEVKNNRHGANISRLSNLHEEIVLHNNADTNPNNDEELSNANQNHRNSRTRRNTRRSNNAGRKQTNNDGAPQEPVTQRRRGRPRQNTRRDQTQQQPNESQTETRNTRRTRANNSSHMDGEDIPTNPEPVQ